MTHAHAGVALAAWTLAAACAAGPDAAPVEALGPQAYAFVCDPAFDPPRCEHQPAEPFRYPRGAFTQGWRIPLVNAGELPLEYRVDSPVLLEPSFLEADGAGPGPEGFPASHPVCGEQVRSLEVTSARRGVVPPWGEAALVAACVGANCDYLPRRSWTVTVHTNEPGRAAPLTLTLSPGCASLNTCGGLCAPAPAEFLTIGGLARNLELSMQVGASLHLDAFHWREGAWEPLDAAQVQWDLVPRANLQAMPDAGPGWFRSTYPGVVMVTGYLDAVTYGTARVSVLP